MILTYSIIHFTDKLDAFLQRRKAEKADTQTKLF